MMKFFENIWDILPKKVPNKSRFNRSREWKHDFNIGLLVPCLVENTLPGDEYELSSEYLFKMDPLYYPMIHRLNMHVDYVWTPYKLMWKEQVAHEPGSKTGWVNWIMNNSDEEHPTVDVDMQYYPSGTNNDSIMGYMGIPYLYESTVDPGSRSTVITGLSAFAPMAYLHYFDQFQRSPQFEAERRFNLNGGDNTAAMVEAFGWLTPTNVRLSCFPAKWGKDYITGGTPEPQIGADAVQIPLIEGTFFPANGSAQDILPENAPNLMVFTDGSGTPGAEPIVTSASGRLEGDSTGKTMGLNIQENAATITELGKAISIQRIRELVMKTGQRYIDHIYAFFGNNPAPGEIIAPILIGSYKAAITVSEVLTKANTTVGESNFFTGDYTGNASLYSGNNQTFRFTCPDYGILMGIISVVPNSGYGQGIERWWRYSVPQDYPLDMLCGIGDQEVLKEEVFYNNVVGEEAKNSQTFSYVPRFMEARIAQNQYGTNLAWTQGLSTHLGKLYDQSTMGGTDYDDLIELSSRFLQCDDVTGGTRVADVFKVLTTPLGNATKNPIICYALHNIFVNRCLPAHSIPAIP